MLGFLAISPFLSRRARIQADLFHPTHQKGSEGDNPKPAGMLALRGIGGRRRACGRYPLFSR
jgi:hypothetical protein